MGAENQALRQRRIATGITRSTAACQEGICANPSSTTQSNLIPGIACWASVSAGNVWRTSPIDDVLTIKTRIRQASSCNNSALSSSSTRWGVMSIKLW
ncbi:Uncharacterised protein [Shigella sonnei]|nr:Uncharacterised protein [Shigella sonnei]